MAKIDDLRAAIAQVGTDLSEAIDRVTARLADIGGPDVDFTEDINRLNEFSTRLDSIAQTGTDPGSTTDPNAPYPDQTLPGDQPHPDQTLPGNS